MNFNPNEHLMQLKSKQGSQDYLPVQWRLVWFRSLCPDGTIETELVHLDMDKECEEETYVWNKEKNRSEKVLKVAKGVAVFKATITDGKGGRATGYKSERGVSFPDYIEKSETGAIGRALAALGYGTQFAPELDEEHRIVDSPVERPPIVAVRPTATTGKTETSPTTASSEQQLSSIRKLCEYLGKPVPTGAEAFTYEQAKAAIAQLSQEYRQSRSKAS